MRKKRIAYHHILKIFNRCDAEWLLVDALAMPDIHEDLTPTQKTDTEVLRTEVTNTLRSIYVRVDKVVCLDGLYLGLQSGSMIDVTIVLSLGR